jgi:thiamine pyrophosphokinase
VEDAKPESALIIAGGSPVQPDLVEQLADFTWVVAADSGLDQAYRLGISPDLVVGDMDSVTARSLNRAIAEGTAIERHPVDKNATDLELAIVAAASAGYRTGTIIGGTGGRIAHTLANAMVLLEDHAISLEWRTGSATIVALHVDETRVYQPDQGTLLSVIAIGEPATCKSQGLRWPLDGIALDAGSTRGVSNEIIAERARVLVTGGQVLTIQERD